MRRCRRPSCDGRRQTLRRSKSDGPTISADRDGLHDVGGQRVEAQEQSERRHQPPNCAKASAAGTTIASKVPGASEHSFEPLDGGTKRERDDDRQGHRDEDRLRAVQNRDDQGEGGQSPERRPLLADHGQRRKWRWSVAHGTPASPFLERVTHILGPQSDVDVGDRGEQDHDVSGV